MLSQAIFERAIAKLTAVEKKKEAVQRQIDVQIQAYALVPKGVDTNETVLYYRRERDRVANKQTTELNAIDLKIQAIEAKKQAAIEKFDADIEALEAKKKALDDKLTSEGERYSSEILRFTTKLEDPEPPTPAFRKLKADLALCIEEETKARDDMAVANTQLLAEMAKRSKRMVDEQMAEYRRREQEERANEQKERDMIEAIRERDAKKLQEEFDAAIARAGPRIESEPPTEPVDHIKEALAAVQSNVIKYNYKSKKPIKHLTYNDLSEDIIYTVDELDTINVDYEIDNENDITLWNKLRREACIREGIPVYGDE